MKPEDTTRIKLILRPLPGNAIPYIGLRRILKSLLRSFGWRCVEAVELPPHGEAAPGCEISPEPHEVRRG